MNWGVLICQCVLTSSHTLRLHSAKTESINSMNQNQIELIARAFILQNGEVLLCRAKSKKHFFFPGGHVEYGEYIKDALRREIGEEIGAHLNLGAFIGITENVFNQDGEEHHEVNVVFEAQIGEKKSKALEDWMEFHWVKLQNLSQTSILPASLKKAILKWNKDKKTFWTRQNECLQK